ncbi:MAG: arginine--tRNA ligase [Cardiobacteriales bacterium]|nr:MAG: arginine--tRNA ligase [Cardiobacteriales bacterium]
MKQEIQDGLASALLLIAKANNIPDYKLDQPIELVRSKKSSHGDFASNIAMRYAKLFKMSPCELADQIVVCVPLMPSVACMEVASPGFINIYLSHDSETRILETIYEQGDEYGKHQSPHPLHILLECISLEPPVTPLHAKSGRGLVFGDTLANVLRANGHEVKCFFQGEYVLSLAHELTHQFGERLVYPVDDWLSEPVKDWTEQEIKVGLEDKFITAAIAGMKAKLGAEDYQRVFAVVLAAMTADMREDLAGLGVTFDRWCDEILAAGSDKIQESLDILQNKGLLYEQDSAVWFKGTTFGDQKDRVVKNKDGMATYFASDIACYYDKYQRGYDLIIDIVDAKHHAYMAKIKASVTALGLNPKKLMMILVQFAVLHQHGKKVKISADSDESLALRALVEAVGHDAARFFYVMGNPEQSLDFDMDLAASHNKDNPFYYIEYAHARTCRILEKAKGNQVEVCAKLGISHRNQLKEKEEKVLLKELARYPEVVVFAGEQFTAHPIANYLRDLAGAWHHYYDSGHKLLHEDESIRSARLLLTLAVQQVLRNGLTIIGVKVFDRM